MPAAFWRAPSLPNSGPAADQIRVGHQPQDRQSARPHGAADYADDRRRGDRMSTRLKRREFITLLGSAATWPLAARAQQTERVRRMGSLTGIADDSMTQARLATFLETLQQLGWTEGQNVQVDRRWGGGDSDRIRKYAAELATLNPDVILDAGAD